MRFRCDVSRHFPATLIIALSLSTCSEYRTWLPLPLETFYDLAVTQLLFGKRYRALLRASSGVLLERAIKSLRCEINRVCLYSLALHVSQFLLRKMENCRCYGPSSEGPLENPLAMGSVIQALPVIRNGKKLNRFLSNMSTVIIGTRRIKRYRQIKR